jgi:hypothetical protein
MIIEDKDKFRIETSRMMLTILLQKNISLQPCEFGTMAAASVALADALIKNLEEMPLPQNVDTKHPIIEDGFIKVTSYHGNSKYIVKGRIYKGYSFILFGDKIIARLKTGVKSTPEVVLRSKNGSWVEATEEEYNEQNDNRG